jgi:hypothetical protein
MYEPIRGSDWARLLPERYHERMIFMTVLRGIAWLGDWSKVLDTWLVQNRRSSALYMRKWLYNSDIAASAGAQSLAPGMRKTCSFTANIVV